MISLAEPYLKYMHSSLVDYGHPHGLIALILILVGFLLISHYLLLMRTDIA